MASEPALAGWDIAGVRIAVLFDGESGPWEAGRVCVSHQVSAAALGDADVRLTVGLSGEVTERLSPHFTNRVEVSALGRDRFGYQHERLRGELTAGPGVWQGVFTLSGHSALLEGVLKIVVSQWLLSRGRLMLHASGVVRDGAVVGFAGASGSGKSTVAAELHGGGEGFSLDRLVLTPDAGAGCLAEATPFSDPKQRELRRRPAAPLAALVFLRQAAEHRVTKLSTLQAVQRVLGHATLFARGPALDDEALRVAEEIAHLVPCFALDFRRDADFWPPLEAAIAEASVAHEEL